MDENKITRTPKKTTRKPQEDYNKTAKKETPEQTQETNRNRRDIAGTSSGNQTKTAGKPQAQIQDTIRETNGKPEENHTRTLQETIRKTRKNRGEPQETHRKI